MDNITIKIMNESDIYVEIMSPKKLKTRPEDFINIKNSNVVEQEVVEVVPEFVEEETYEEEKEDVELKPEQDFVYGARIGNTDEIDLDKIAAIKNMGSTYKGGNPQEDIKKVEVAKKEEKKAEDKLSKEEYEVVLKESSYSNKISAFKNKISLEYEKYLGEIKLAEKEISDITGDYSKETEVGYKLQDSKKDLQSTLNGINSWNLEFLLGKKEEADTKVLLETIEGYFEKGRNELNDVLHKIKSCDERKELLGKAEQTAREKLSGLKNQLQSFMEKTYPELVKANNTDKELKETDARITELTGIAEESNLEFKTESGPVLPTGERATVTGIRNLGDIPFAHADTNTLNQRRIY